MSTVSSPAFQLRGRLFTLSIMRLLSADPDRLIKQLQQQIDHMPNFFKQMPIVLDLNALTRPLSKSELSEILTTLSEHQLCPVGLCQGNDWILPLSAELKLPLLSNSSKPAPEKAAQSPEKKPSELATTPLDTKVIDKPVRSGQQIYATGDLIVLGTVSAGAELLAEGNIHVYGALRGRALAGCRGNQNAHIFCQLLAAELVSIAGYYLIDDASEKVLEQEFAHVCLAHDQLQINKF